MTRCQLEQHHFHRVAYREPWRPPMIFLFLWLNTIKYLVLVGAAPVAGRRCYVHFRWRIWSSGVLPFWLNCRYDYFTNYSLEELRRWRWDPWVVAAVAVETNWTWTAQVYLWESETLVVDWYTYAAMRTGPPSAWRPNQTEDSERCEPARPDRARETESVNGRKTTGRVRNCGYKLSPTLSYAMRSVERLSYVAQLESTVLADYVVSIIVIFERLFVSLVFMEYQGRSW